MVASAGGDEAQAIVHAISTSTNTAVAATRLQRLLHDSVAGKGALENAKENGHPPTSNRGSGTTARVRGRNAAKQPNQTSIDLELSKIQHEKKPRLQLGEREKYALATNAFNASLAALSGLHKHTARRASCQSQTRLSRSDRDSTSILSKDAATEPLSPRKNQRHANNTAGRNLQNQKTEDAPGAQTDGALAIVKCANTSLRFLGARTGRVPQLQLLNGILALTKKCLGLNLLDQAAEALEYLKLKLEQDGAPESIRTTERKPARLGSSQAAKIQKQAGSASLLDISAAGFTENVLPLVMEYQLQVLKLLALQGVPNAIEAAVRFLQSDHIASPMALALKFSEDSKENTKAARQLENISRAVFALCPSVATAADSLARDTKRSPDAAVVFQLQEIAFRARLHWWALATHHGNATTEFWDPVAKCANAFARRAGGPVEEVYSRVLRLFEEMSAALAAYQPKGVDHSFGTNALRILAAVAKKANRAQEATRWISQLQNQLRDHSVSGAQAAACAVELAALHLAKGSSEASERLKEAAKLLTGELTGAPADRDVLFGEMMNLRKAALQWIIKRATDGSTVDRTRESPENTFSTCCEAIALCAGHVRRYTVPQSGHRKGDELSQSTEATSLHARALTSTLDALLACARGLPEFEPVSWKCLDAGLSDCASILHTLNVPHTNGEQEKLKLACSRVYWTWYLRQKKADQKGRAKQDILLCLQKCVDLLRGVSHEGKSAAVYDVKSERLSAELASAGDFEKAEVVLLDAVRWLVRTGTLQDIESAACTQSCMNAWATEKGGQSLSRILKKLHQLLVKNDKQYPNLLDSAGLQCSEGEKAVLLEWCLSTSAHAISGDLNKIGAALLSAYNPRDFPLRRKRAAASLLVAARQSSFNLGEEVLAAATHGDDKPIKDLRNDGGLAAFSAHYDACHNVARAFLSSPPSLDLIISAVKTWSAEPAPPVDHLDSWVSHLQLISDYLHVVGHLSLRTDALAVLVKACQQISTSAQDCAGIVQARCDLARHYMEVGGFDLASKELQQARNLCYESEIVSASLECVVSLHLTDALYHQLVGNSDACLNALVSVQWAGERLTSATPSDASSNLKQLKLRADALEIFSQLSLRTSGTDIALAQAKRALKIRQRIWAILERQTSMQARPADSSVTETIRLLEATPFDPLNAGLQKSNLKQAGPKLWSHALCLIGTQLHTARVFAAMGFWQETIYYGEQAERVARSIGSTRLLIQTGTLLLRWWSQSGRSAKVQTRSEELSSLMISYEDYQSAAAIRLEQGRMVYHEGEGELAIEHFDDALSLLEKMNPSRRVEAAADEVLSNQMQSLRIDETSQTSSTSGGTTRLRKNTFKPSPHEAKRRPPKNSEETSAPVPNWIIAALRTDIVCSKIDAYTSMNDLQAARLLCSSLQGDSTVRSLLTQHTTAYATLMQSMEADCTYNSLSESTLALPLMRSDNVLSGISTATNPADLGQTKPSRTNKRKEPAKRKQTRLQSGAPQSSMQGLIHKLLEGYNLAQRTSSNWEVRSFCRGLAEMRFLLSAIDRSDVSLNPRAIGSDLNFPSSRSLILEYGMIKAERIATNADLQLWPSCQIELSADNQSLPMLQDDCSDLLPLTWSAVSVLLNETRDELFITRYDANRPPFVLRLPMHRHRSREDNDDETFTFQHGRDELRDIIEASNSSAHSSKDMSVKGAKSQWWAERTELDTRLRELLVNIENIWFGGFKSIFSQHSAEAEHLEELHSSISSILGQHLPSRRSRKRKSEGSFDSRIVDLFVGLGDPTGLSGEQSFEFCNDVTDLLHFLVDNLQLQGESNAYDEIDFDEMIVDTIDALKAWHQDKECVGSAASAHTVLVLDKDLHAFPWESMPFLQGKSVSRLPSLAALRERLAVLHAQKSAIGLAELALDRGYRASRRTGTSILNPAGDLSRTESVLTPYLAQLPPAWTQYCGPQRGAELNETTWSDALCKSDILLYFGHGNTAQYVRARGVRKLSPAGLSPAQVEESIHGGLARPVATTLLMGCSSVAITENGQFQPHGMVMAYLAAGAPAVAGCLWDVTDRDCDRFSVECGRRWGLWTDEGLESPEKPKQRLAKGTTRVQEASAGSKKPTASNRRRAPGADSNEFIATKAQETGAGFDQCFQSRRTLTEAVAESRSACYLKYLNGAAMVVYGIPVYID